MRSKDLILFLLIPLSEIKAIFYDSDMRVSWFLFSDNKRLLCNTIEDYANIIIFGVVFYFLAFTKPDFITKNICAYLFFLNALDLVHLGLYDMQLFIIPKLIVAYAVYYLWSRLRHSY